MTDSTTTKDAEIASLRAELSSKDEELTTANCNLDAFQRKIWKLEEAARRDAETIAHLLKLANGLSSYADGHELRGRWMEELKALRQELAECNGCEATIYLTPNRDADAETASLRAESSELDFYIKKGAASDDQISQLLAAARQDAETIARLREALQRIELESVDDVSRADARAAVMPHIERGYMREDKDAQIANLRAELAAWKDTAYDRGLSDPEEMAFQLDGDSRQLDKQKAAARRDAETIARLREALQRIEYESVDDVSRADARAALAHLPQEEPSQRRMRLHASAGSVDVEPGYRFTDSDGMQWEVVRETGGGIYSPVGVGGTNIVECRHIGGNATNVWKQYIKGDLGEWCGDSLACAIIGHQSREARRQKSET